MDDEDQKLAAEHYEAWKASAFQTCSEIMRKFRAKYPEQARQEGDGTVAIYDTDRLERFNLNSQVRERFDTKAGWVKVEVTT